MRVSISVSKPVRHCVSVDTKSTEKAAIRMTYIAYVQKITPHFKGFFGTEQPDFLALLLKLYKARPVTEKFEFTSTQSI